MEPKLLTPGVVCRLLNCDRKQLAKIRAARPDIAIRLPSMRNWRYITDEISKLCRPRGPEPH